MSMGSLKTLAEDHHCHDILLESSILTDHGQWHADPNSNSDFSHDLGSESDATAAGHKHQTPQGTQGLGTTMATDQTTFPSESSKASGEGSSTSPSPSLSSSEEADLTRSELSHGAESCQLDPVPGCLKWTVSGTDNMSPSHVSVNNGARPDQPGDEGGGDDKSDVTTGQRNQQGEDGRGEKSCPPIRRDVSQEITILVTSHDTCVGDEQEEKEEEEEEEKEEERKEGEEENERAGELERASSPENIKDEEIGAPSQDEPAPAEGAVEGCIVVASLTSTSEVKRLQIVGSNSLETGTDRASNAQCEDAKVTGGNQESSDPISTNSSGCLPETQSEVKRPTEANSPLVDDLTTDLDSQCTTKSVPTESESAAVTGNTNDHKNVDQLPTTNKSHVGDSKERLQKAKTLDLSSGRFSAPPGKTDTVQGQSSLEVVACHSVATSPMTPPEGSAAFLFPYSSGKAGTGNGIIAEKKEVRSVATAPMSPQNLAAPEGFLDPRTTGVEKRSVATAPMSPQNLTAPEALPDVLTAGVEMRSVATAPMTPQNLTAPETFPDTHTAGVEMRSIATAPMTPQNLTAPECIPDAHTAEVEMRSVATTPMTPQNLTAPEGLPNIQTSGVEMRSVATTPMTPQNLTAPEGLPDIQTSRVEMRSVATTPMTPQNLTAPEGLPDIQTSGVEMRSVATTPMTPQNLTAPEALPDVRTAGVETRSVATAPMSPQNLTAPASIPDTRKVGSVQTQKSLEVMSHSVATSPMTPPGGSAAFLFPQPKKIELRSVATAPMSPQGLLAPEAIPETCPAQEEPTSPDIIPEPRAIEPGNALTEPSEPLQDVSWDEKGMTWDVYGAVVEVAVLGTAIQKHLEKQVQKQRKQTTSDAGSPTKSQALGQTLTQSQSPSEAQSSVDGVSSTPATGTVSAGSQKRRHPKEEKSDSVKRNGRRKNPLRGRFRRLQWPSCCSRSRPEEAP